MVDEISCTFSCWIENAGAFVWSFMLTSYISFSIVCADRVPLLSRLNEVYKELPAFQEAMLD
ncbi:hypothetical protein LguiA_036159 [Lonicera macranthoides]